MANIGRKIYFDISTGNMLVDTGECSGDVIETTIEQDFIAYTALKERVPETVGMLQLSYGQYADEFQQCYGYHINPNTEEIIFNFVGVDANLKEIKIAELDRKCNETILGTFTSSAMGEPHVYVFDYEAQMNFAGVKQAFVDDLITEIKWNTRDAGVLIHNKSQFEQLWLDGFMHKATNIEKFRLLKAQVEQAATNEEINAVTW